MPRIVRLSLGAALAVAILAPSAASAVCTVTLEDRRFGCPGGGTCSATFPVVECDKP